MTANPILWYIFIAIVVAAMAVDLGLSSHRHRDGAVSLGEAARWSAIWVGLALAFAWVVYHFEGRQMALEFVTGYLVEESLSVDNMFVFILIFSFFAIPAKAQPRVLKWGILGAIVMRFGIILAGVHLLERFEWLLYVFGALLIYTAIKITFERDSDLRPDKNPLLRLFNRFMPMTKELHGESFFVRVNDRWTATPLFAALLVVEASDLMFATDSIPAVLAISRHPFIVFSSNIFAIMGLRALYFLVSGVMEMFRFLRYGLAFILVFIGLKMLLKSLITVPIGISLGVVGLSLVASIIISLIWKEK